MVHGDLRTSNLGTEDVLDDCELLPPPSRIDKLPVAVAMPEEEKTLT